MSSLTREYLENRIRTASSIELIVIIYEATVQFLLEAKQGMEAGNVEKKTNAINRASRCISELQVSLNMDKGGTVAQNLAKLYDFCQWKIMAAHQNNTLEGLDEVLQIFRGLLDSWNQLSKTRPVAAGSGLLENEAAVSSPDKPKGISFSI